jgi:hypothetical protein
MGVEKMKSEKKCREDKSSGVMVGGEVMGNDERWTEGK